MPLTRISPYLEENTVWGIDAYILELKKKGVKVSQGLLIETLIEYLTPMHNPDFTDFLMSKAKERAGR